MRVLVCGGRNYDDQTEMFATLDRFEAKHEVNCIVHGAARGADLLAGLWAYRRDVPVDVYPADWNKHGRSAGPIRNREMLIDGKPDIVIAFPGGAGTANMTRIAKKHGVRVHYVGLDKEW